jgi:TRAP-type C4-dicarboxylate transport system permease small subunit
MTRPIAAHAVWSTVRGYLGAAHDWLTRGGFAIACLLIGLSTCALTYEVVARYFFNAPTDWASPIVSYFLVGSIFLAMPELTRQSAHISITIVLDAVPAPCSDIARRVICLVSALACLLAAWFSADESFNQFVIGIQTNPPLPLPKWIVSAVVPYGMLSSAMYFLRQLANDEPAASLGVIS